jgi:hypothetical protein
MFELGWQRQRSEASPTVKAAEPSSRQPALH